MWSLLEIDMTVRNILDLVLARRIGRASGINDCGSPEGRNGKLSREFSSERDEG
jgi:hypothetical protein